MVKRRTVPKRDSRKAAAEGSQGSLTLREYKGWFYALKSTPEGLMERAKAFLGHIYAGRLMIRADALASSLHTLKFRGFAVTVERAGKVAA